MTMTMTTNITNMTKPAALILVPALLTILACGVPDMSLGEPGDASDSSDATDATDTTDTSDASDSSDATDTSDSSEGPAESCPELEDDPEPSTSKVVRVVNSTPGPLWLPAAPCGDSFEVATEEHTRFQMTVDGVEAVDLAPYCARCATLDSFCPYAPDAPNCCEGPGLCVGAIRIGAGESFDIDWPTAVYTKTAISEDCTEMSCEPDAQCRVRRAVEAGSMVEMQLRAVTACDDGGDPSCGECPDGQTCTLGANVACDAAVAFAEAEVAFELELDDGIIELQFQ